MNSDGGVSHDSGPVGEGGNDCLTPTTCGPCVTASSLTCGFCADTNTCMQGTSTGPNNGTCSNWMWTTSDCPGGGGGDAGPPPPPCSSHTNCMDCTLAAPYDCGWCSDTNQCMQGVASGPGDGGMTCTWAWTSDMCPGAGDGGTAGDGG